MVEGRFLMRDRRLTTIHEADAVAEAQEATLSMWRAFGAEDRGVPLPRHDLA
jgi:5-methylthioadenosine/S-adenosylhomocysteine deaminase